MWQPWRLLRSPLSPGVPLEGTDTVQGLRILERQRLAEALQQPADGSGSAAAAAGAGWRRRFQRYRGPYIEQLSTEDLKREPRSWAVFWKGSETGQLAQVRVFGCAPQACMEPCSQLAVHGPACTAAAGCCRSASVVPPILSTHLMAQAYNLPASLDVLHERTEVGC